MQMGQSQPKSATAASLSSSLKSSRACWSWDGCAEMSLGWAVLLALVAGCVTRIQTRRFVCVEVTQPLRCLREEGISVAWAGLAKATIDNSEPKNVGDVRKISSSFFMVCSGSVSEQDN